MNERLWIFDLDFYLFLHDFEYGQLTYGFDLAVVTCELLLTFVNGVIHTVLLSR